MFIPWDQLYDYIGIRDFIYFISNPDIQAMLFPIKLVFIAFTIFFFCAVIWFYFNSTYLKYKFLQDTTEFLSKETYGLGAMTKNWKKIKKRAQGGTESELKLAIIEADDFLYESLQDMDYQGSTFEEMLNSPNKKRLPDFEEILEAHQVRNAIVYEPNYELDLQQAKRILLVYENAVKNVVLG